MNKIVTSDTQPIIGMGVTIQYWSDSYAGTIIQIERGGKKLIIQRDTATLIGGSRVSDAQVYLYELNTNGEVYFATLRKDGRYRISKSNQLVILNTRHEYFDPHF